MRLLLAGLWPRPPEFAPRRRLPAEPRQERLFGRPFPCLVESGGVLIPVVVTVGEGWGSAAAAAEREALEAEAAARKN